MKDALARAAAQGPADPSVVGRDAAWTYAELDRVADDLAERLAGLGVRPGEHVGLLLPGSALGVALLHAGARAGAVLVPLDPRLPGPELRARAQHADLKLCIADEAPAELQGALPVRSVPQLLRSPRRSVALFVQHANRALALVFTSGTSGKPRAVILSQGNLEAAAAASARNLPLARGDRWLACVPLFHVGGLAAAWRTARDGACLQVLPRFDAAQASDALDHGATVASMVPTMLQRVLDHRAARPFPAGARGILLGGAAAPRALLEHCRAVGAPVLPTYGLTEATSQVATAPAGADVPPGCAGKPLPGVGVAILDEHAAALPRGDAGEIVVSGPTVARGYYKDPDATARAFRPEGLRTGDLGFLDKDGFLWVVGRLDERITTGGEKVDPGPVEEALRSHPAVREACVVGLPDATWGQLVAAAVVLASPASPEELQEHCRRLLAGFQVPKRFLVLKELPRGPSGKVLRDEVKTLLARAT